MSAGVSLCLVFGKGLAADFCCLSVDASMETTRTGARVPEKQVFVTSASVMRWSVLSSENSSLNCCAFKR
jgi:hypothetical protein